eukprot:GHVT01055864.1.p1 GENE.GHVT01055864.1~~GHVT01055864.1.p1  ORF type:complete len:159 (+),score=19.59 GHVT01055864.1:134-610(+)
MLLPQYGLRGMPWTRLISVAASRGISASSSLSLGWPTRRALSSIQSRTVPSLVDVLRNAAPGSEKDAVYLAVCNSARAAYAAEKATVDASLLPLLQSQPLVLFMEGHVDAPQSLLSLNVVKMLTQAQATPLLAVDCLKHPAILGFALEQASGTLKHLH